MKCIYLVSIFISCNMFIAGQDSVFTIQSFKPENIRDGQILVRLSNYYNNSVDEQNSLDEPQEEKENSFFWKRFQTSIDWDYKYETEKVLLYTNLYPSLGYSNNYSDYVFNKDDAVPGQIFHSYYERESRSKGLDGRIKHFLVGSRYIVNKFGLTGFYNINFWSLKNNSNNKYEGTRFYDSDTDAAFYEWSEEKEYDYIKKNINMEVKIGPIYGRVYEGLYAAKAIELIDELTAQGQLITEPNAVQLKQLSQIIYEEMTRYYYDSRIKRVESLKRITAWLVSENIIEDSINPFLTIMDIYEYSIQRKRSRYNSSEFLPSQTYYRPHGFIIGVVMGSAYSETNDINKGYKTDISYRTTYDSLWQIVDLDTFDTSESYAEKKISNGSGSKGIVLFMNYARPYGWHWQLIAGAKISFNKVDSTNLHWLGDGISTQPYVNNYGYGSCKQYNGGRINETYPSSASLDLQLQYFMDSRTRFELFFRTDFSKIMNHFSKTYYTMTDSGNVKTIIPFEKNYKSLYLITGFSSTYYFTPRIALYSNVTHNLRKTWDSNYISDHELFESLNFTRQNIWYNSFNFTLSLNYYIF